MDLVFSTETIAPQKRYDAWRDAICDFYVQVEVNATRPEEYRGFIRESHFGDAVLTDIQLSEQRIRRSEQHISRLGKDCYYLQLVQNGSVEVFQQGAAHLSNPARGALFCATEKYELQARGDVRAFYLEFPRDDFARRFPRDSVPIADTINCTRGLGRIASEFCASLTREGGSLDAASRAELGNQLMDLMAFTLMSGEGDMPEADGAVKSVRLRAVQRWIEAHISDPELSLEKIAHANNMSLRYLHLLFEPCEMSASEWIRNRRLELSYDAIARWDGASITSIAFDHGFNSSAHFSTAFRRRFGVAPRDVRRGEAPRFPGGI